MNKGEIVAQIATLPQRFRSLGDVSMFSLLEATNYFAFHDRISEADIGAALARYPESVEAWIQYSEDKRTSGWYIVQHDTDGYEVGYAAANGDRSEQVCCDNRIKACASFIKHELENIRRV
jgi:hypothetical protein